MSQNGQLARLEELERQELNAKNDLNNTLQQHHTLFRYKDKVRYDNHTQFPNGHPELWTARGYLEGSDFVATSDPRRSKEKAERNAASKLIELVGQVLQ